MSTIPHSPAGGAVTYQNAQGGGDQYLASAGAFLHVRNGGGAPITVTLHGQQPCNQGTTHDLAVSVPNASDRLIGPIDAGRFADVNGFVQVTYSGVTTVTVGVLGA